MLFELGLKIPRIVRFILAGGFSFAINLGLLHFLVSFKGVHYLVASVASVSVGLVFSFTLQKYFTFEDNVALRIPRQISWYALLGILNVIANTAFLFLFVQFGGLHYIVGQVITSFLLAFVSFFVYRDVVFVDKGRVLTPNQWLIFWILFTTFFVTVLIFLINGPLDMRVDGNIFVGQVNSFEEGNIFQSNNEVLLHLFKPLYGVLGSLVVPLTSPAVAIQFFNITFFVILGVSFFYYLRQLSFPPRYAGTGVLWLITAYPLLKYGLAISTDIAGWALAVLSTFLFLKGLSERKLWFIILASFCGALGFFAKETGVLGLFFSGLVLLFSLRSIGFRFFIRALSALVLPFVFTVGSYLLYIANRAPTFLDWYQKNMAEHSGSWKLYYFIFTETSAFSLLWPLAFLGALSLILKKTIRGENNNRFWMFVAAFIATLPVLAWPMFISRVLFIQFLWVIPLALFGLTQAVSLMIRALPAVKPKFIRVALTAAPVAFSIGLFVMSAGQSLYRFFVF